MSDVKKALDDLNKALEQSLHLLEPAVKHLLDAAIAELAKPSPCKCQQCEGMRRSKIEDLRSRIDEAIKKAAANPSQN